MVICQPKQVLNKKNLGISKICEYDSFIAICIYENFSASYNLENYVIKGPQFSSKLFCGKSSSIFAKKTKLGKNVVVMVNDKFKT